MVKKQTDNGFGTINVLNHFPIIYYFQRNNIKKDLYNPFLSLKREFVIEKLDAYEKG